MQTTANYGLKKPEGNDTVDIDVINGNMDTIDGQLKKLSSAMGDDPDFKTTLSNAISVKTNQTDFSSHVNALTVHGIGDRTQLKTSAKDTIVNALNELKTAIPSVPVQSVNGETGSVSLGASDIIVSDSSGHFSSNPKNVENVLAELFTSGTNGKNDIYNAISAKGTTPASKNFSDLVSAIGNISTGKKFASGNFNTGELVWDGQHVLLEISSLSFTPSLVIVVTAYQFQWKIFPLYLLGSGASIGGVIGSGNEYYMFDTVQIEADRFLNNGFIKEITGSIGDTRSSLSAGTWTAFE
ncbi:hypothetical protein ACJDT4_00335 [Clostridium neuense]|uniref:Uncharacterized protein n=1 Tax=Clostridium neuense TaxID=1728934 RepID=A0ABW8T9J9_9CLOT